MKHYKVVNLRTKAEYTKTEEEVNALKAAELFKPGNYQIIELKTLTPPAEALAATKGGKKDDE